MPNKHFYDENGLFDSLLKSRKSFVKKGKEV